MIDKIELDKRYVCQECGVTLTDKEKELAEEFGNLLCEICEAKISDSFVFIDN